MTSSASLPWLHTPTWAGALLLYLLVGAGVAVGLARGGHPALTALCALPCWPWMVGLLGKAPNPPQLGPLSDRIMQAFAFVESSGTYEESAFGGHPSLRSDLTGLRASLQRTDARLALADQIIADLSLEPDSRGDLELLREGRARVAREVEAVLTGLRQLRIQVGLLALSEVRGDNVSQVQDRVRELQARVASLDELSSLVSGPKSPPG